MSRFLRGLIFSVLMPTFLLGCDNTVSGELDSSLTEEFSVLSFANKEIQDTTSTLVISTSNPKGVWSSYSSDAQYIFMVKDGTNTNIVCQLGPVENKEVSVVDIGCSFTEAIEYFVFVYAFVNGKQVEAKNSGFKFMVDQSPPTVQINVAPPAIDANANPSIQLGGSDGQSSVSKYFCSLDGAEYEECSGVFVAVGLPDGSHSISIKAVDEAGNESAPVTHNWIIDTSGPSAFYISGVEGGTDTTVDQWLTDTAPDIHWAAATGAISYDVVVRNEANTVDVCSVQTTASTNYDFSGCTLTDGLTYKVQVTASDGSTTVHASNSLYTFFVDTSAPTVTIDSEPSNPDTNSTPTFEFSGTDEGSGIDRFECQVDSGGYVTCSSPYTLSSLSEGEHSFDVRAVDVLGQVSDPESHSWYVNNPGPNSFNITGVIGGSDISKDNWFTDLTAAPTVYWSVVIGSPSFEATIYESDGTSVACPTETTTGTNVTFVGCSLLPNVEYKIRVTATEGGVSADAANSPYSMATQGNCNIHNTVLHVGLGQTYSSMKAAYDASSHGDAIVVHTGNYNESALKTVSKKVSFYGSTGDPNDVVISGSVGSDWWIRHRHDLAGVTGEIGTYHLRFNRNQYSWRHYFTIYGAGDGTWADHVSHFENVIIKGNLGSMYPIVSWSGDPLVRIRYVDQVTTSGNYYSFVSGQNSGTVAKWDIFSVYRTGYNKFQYICGNCTVQQAIHGSNSSSYGTSQYNQADATMPCGFSPEP